MNTKRGFAQILYTMERKCHRLTITSIMQFKEFTRKLFQKASQLVTHNNNIIQNEIHGYMCLYYFSVVGSLYCPQRLFKHQFLVKLGCISTGIGVDSTLTINILRNNENYEYMHMFIRLQSHE